MEQSTKILLVEDFKATQLMEKKVLKSIGYTNIILAENGVDAIEKLLLEESKDIGLVISDWNMPEMNGYELLEWLRDSDQFKDLPFLMATAQGEKKKSKKAIKRGANNFIIKPFNGEELKKAIDDIFHTKDKDQKSIPIKKVPKLKKGKVQLKIAHIQITDHLVLGVLKDFIESGKEIPKTFDLETICMKGWNPVQKALENGEVDGALILAPMAMDLFAYDIPLKLVLLAHKNGSIFVNNKDFVPGESVYQFAHNKKFYIPHLLSVHHMLANILFREAGLTPGVSGDEDVDVFFEVVPPIQMPKLLTENSDSSGFMVAEPLGTNTIKKGNAGLVFLSGELWPNHPCCVLTMREEIIGRYEESVYEFTDMMVKAGQFITQDISKASDIAVSFLDPKKALGLKKEVLAEILNEPGGILTNDLYPVMDDFEKMQRYMKEEMDLGTLIDVEKFIDTRFAEKACLQNVEASKSNFSFIHDLTKKADHIITRKESHDDKVSKKTLFDVKEFDRSIQFDIPSDMKMVDIVINKLENFLKKLHFTSFYDFKIISRELLLNAIEHGNKNQFHKKVFFTVIQVDRSIFKLIVEDEGEGFDYRKIVEGIPSDTIRQRGFPLIQHLSEKMEFNQAGNRVSALINIHKDVSFNVVEGKNWVTVYPSGNITAAASGKLKQIFIKLLKEPCKGYRFDFRYVEDIDSIGLSNFIIFSKILKNNSIAAKLEIINASKDLANLFRMTQLHYQYNIA